MAQFPERLGFDLANTFTGYLEVLANFFQSMVFAIRQAEAKFNKRIVR